MSIDKNKSIRERNKAIDILKGIGILFVLVAHSLEGFVSQFAYTFHIPLFFIVTGLFIFLPDKKTLNSCFLKDLQRLLVPAFFTYTIIFIISLLIYVYPIHYLCEPLDIIWNSNPQKYLNNVVMLGNLWFLFALFWGKQFMYVLYIWREKSYFGLFGILLGSFAVIIGQFVLLPFDIIEGMSILPFIVIGYYLKTQGGIDSIRPYFYLLIPYWMIYVIYGKMNVSFIQYSWFYIPDILAACGGTLFFYIISDFISRKTKLLGNVLAFLGMYSLILICAPSIETYCFPMQEIIPDIPYRKIFIILAKVGWCALAMWLCFKISILRKIFSVK